MKRALWLLMAAGLLAGPSNAQVPNVPVNAEPEFRIVNYVDPNNQTVVFLLKKTVNQMVPKKIIEKVLVNGKEQESEYMIYVPQPVQVTVTQVWSAKTGKAYDGEGFLLPVEKVMQLKRGDGVIVTHNQKLEQAFGHLLNKKAVVLVIMDQQ